MPNLYADENFPRPVVERLRELGHVIETVQESGRGNIGFPDPGVFELARSSGRAVLTLNRKDYLRLHASQPDHAGIVVCRQSDSPADFDDLAVLIDEAVRREEPLSGKVVRVVRPNRNAPPKRP